MTGWIGISLGDVTGIGPEVTLKALREENGHDQFKYLIIGDAHQIQAANEQFECRLHIEPFQSPAAPGRFFQFDPRPEPLPKRLTQGSPAAANAALDWLREGARRCLQQELDALVTAPVNKAAIIQTGTPFVGQTEFLSEIAGTERTGMVLVGTDDRGRHIRVILVTTHMPLALVANSITPNKVIQSIELAEIACQQLGLDNPRLAVCGLNPHAGEEGALGMEETSIILPAVLQCQERGIDVSGPLAADTLFYHAYRGEYDLVVAMYHDQGLSPVKMIGFESGINWTVGLPFIRTSPDHGTAYNIAGQGVASPKSMMAALSLARQLVRRSERQKRPVTG